MTHSKTFRIATIPGDGIGKEVIPAGQQVVEAVADKHGFTVSWDVFDWSCERYTKTGRMMPDDGIEQIKNHDAIFFGRSRFSRSCRSRIALGINLWQQTNSHIWRLDGMDLALEYECRHQSHCFLRFRSDAK